MSYRAAPKRCRAAVPGINASPGRVQPAVMRI
jgi:hypothetical protein